MNPRTPLELALWCDSVLANPAVVVGSAPAAARDLDLLCPPPAAAALARALTDAEFVRFGDAWVRFTGGGAEVIDVLSLTMLPERAAAATLARSTHAPGCRHVRLPAPEHRLLLIARRTAGDRGPLPEKRRDEITALLQVRPVLWSIAEAEAVAFGARRALAALRLRYDGHVVSRAQRIAARLERDRSTGGRAVTAFINATVPRRRPSPVIALCGLDGAGKSTQATALAETLELLGHAVTVEWSRITYDPMVERVAAPVKRLLGRRSGRGRNTRATGDAVAVGRSHSLGSSSRARWVTALWVPTLVLIHAAGHRSARRRAAGRVIIRDRSVYDSLVQLRVDYSSRTDTRISEWLLQRVTPKALITFFLDVPPDVAAARKDDFTAAELATHRAAYLDLLRDRDVVRLDATQPRDVLSAAVAAATMRALSTS